MRHSAMYNLLSRLFTHERERATPSTISKSPPQPTKKEGEESYNRNQCSEMFCILHTHPISPWVVYALVAFAIAQITLVSWLFDSPKRNRTNVISLLTGAYSKYKKNAIGDSNYLDEASLRDRSTGRIASRERLICTSIMINKLKFMSHSFVDTLNITYPPTSICCLSAHSTTFVVSIGWLTGSTVAYSCACITPAHHTDKKKKWNREVNSEYIYRSLEIQLPLFRAAPPPNSTEKKRQQHSALNEISCCSEFCGAMVKRKSISTANIMRIKMK